MRRIASETIKILAPGGGFLFASIHNITPEVPPENILALFETARPNTALYRLALSPQAEAFDVVGLGELVEKGDLLQRVPTGS